MFVGEAPFFLPPSSPRITDRLIRTACVFYGLEDEAVLYSRRRRGEISLARWAVWYVLHHDIGWGTKRIGRLFAKDWKAVQYGLRHGELLLRSDPMFFEAVDQLRHELSPR